jgi:ribosomal protein S18 acetylase RimI-like enzyme
MMPPLVIFRTPTKEDLPALAKAFQVSFSDYFVPMNMDETHLREFIYVNDIDLKLSFLAETPSGQPVGQALSGRRGEQGWIGGVGLHPEYRGKGIARDLVRKQLMAFRDGGVQEVTLEVLSQNERAMKLYDKLGFETVRDLQYYRHMRPEIDDAPVPENLRFEDAPIEAVIEMYTPDHPWQTMKESLSKGTDLKAFMSFRVQGGSYSEELGFEMPDVPKLPDQMLAPQGPELEGYCIYRVFEKGIMIVDLYSANKANELVKQMIRLSEGKAIYAHHVFDEAAIEAYDDLGFERYLIQHELSKNVLTHF